MRIAVTGAFGYSGRYIAQRLLDAGHDVLTLTNSPNRPHVLGDRVAAAPFNFDAPAKLKDSLDGVDALINTYWVRFDHRLFTHDQAVANTKILFSAARDAGVRKIVHVSITRPDRDSNLPYFRGKAELEESLKSLGVAFTILRPTVLFGKEDILINNIAWALRRFPVYGLFGDGTYKLQPIYVDDLAALSVAKAQSAESETIEAIGPETYTYRGLVRMIRDALGLRRFIVGLPPTVGYWSCRLLGMLVGDVIVTREEIQGLMEGRLCVDAPAAGTTCLSAWVGQHRDSLGRRYASEMSRRLDRKKAY